MQTNNHIIVDYDAVLDAKFGKEGTPERAHAEEAAYSIYSGQILQEARKEAKVTPVARILRENGISFLQEVYSSEFPELSVLGTDKKRFDFYIETTKRKYLIEVNFYSGGGSKLNEVARAYTELAPKVNSVKGFEFVWITDGIGWKSARTNWRKPTMLFPVCIIWRIFHHS